MESNDKDKMNPCSYKLSNQDDVIALKEESPHSIIISHPMFKVGELVDAIHENVLGISSGKLEENYYKPRKKWIDDGLDCEVLHIRGEGWQKGKIRIKVAIEFVPDEPIPQPASSPLDDIRQSIDRTF